MKKKITIIAIFITIFLISTLTFFVIRDLKEEEKFKKEIEEISLLMDFETINKEVENRLSIIVTKYDYAKLEKYTKRYLKRVYKSMINIAEILNDEQITTCLTASNYRKDGPNFVQTKNFLKEAINTLKEEKDIYIELLSEEKAMSYVENKGFNHYYLELYKKELIISDEDRRKIEKSLDDMIFLLETSLEIINLLQQNSYQWQVSNDNIIFYNVTLQNQYNDLFNQIIK